MPDLSKIKELEQELLAMKAQREAGQISIDKYVDQAGTLRFVDETDGQEWWLDPETAQWHVAPAETMNFQLASPQPGKPSESPPTYSTGETPPPPKEGGEKSEKVATAQTPPEESETSPPGDQQASATQEFGALQEVDGKSLSWPSYKLALRMGGTAIIFVLCIIAGLYLWRSWPTLISQVAEATSTPTFTQPATFTPTFIALTPTLTAIPSSPEDMLTPTFPIAPLTPTHLPTATTMPTVTFTPEPEPPPDNRVKFSGKLAYPFYDPDQETFVTQVVNLVSGQKILTLSQASQPALTSDGQRLAYHSWNPQGIGLFAISLLNSAVPGTISRFQESHRPQWGPDNKAVVFSFLQAQDDNEIKTIQFSDDDPPLPIGGFGQTATWTPDGRLVFHACSGTHCGLAVANTNGSGLTFLTDKTQDISPAVSPDGQWIVYTSEQDGNWDVFQVSIAGGQPIRLTTQPGKDGIPAWSPDGAYIAYASEQNGSWAIWVMTGNGGGKQKLLDLPGSLEGRAKDFPYDAQRGWQLESISWSR
jgi:Tol biopolymer transport system component